MDTAARRPTDELARQCLEHVRRLPFVRRATLGTTKRTGDVLLSIDTPDGRHELRCETHRANLSRETAQALVHSAKRRQATIVLAPAVGRDLADLFEQERVNFVDVAGNCYLRLGDRYIARLQGRRAPAQLRTDRGLRAPAYRVLFALLVKPDLIVASSRAIASEADVSPQTANDLRAWLLEQGLVLEAGGRRRWAPGRRKDAVLLWLAGFTTTLGPSLMIGHFRAKEREPRELERRIEPQLDASCEWRYGGGAAATRLTGHYRGDRTVLYVRDAPPDLSNRLRLVRDMSGPITLQRGPGRPAFESPHPRCVHPLLAYADLLAEGHDRAREAAAELHNRFLAAVEQAS
jgi:hypothetical protein